MGVSFISFPASLTTRVLRSTSRSPFLNKGEADVVWEWRWATRSRASNSPVRNGLVT